MASITKLIARKIVFPLLVKSGLNKLLINRSAHNVLILNYHGVVKNTNFGISVNHMSAEDFEMQVRYFSKNCNIISIDEFYQYAQDPKSIHTNKKSILITFDDGYENNYLNAFPILQKYNAPAIIFPVTGLTGSEKTTWYDAIDITKKHLSEKRYSDELSALARQYNIEYNSIIDLPKLSSSLKNFDVPTKNDFIDKYLNIYKNVNLNETSEFWKMLNQDQIRKMVDSKLISFGSHTVHHPNLDKIPSEQVIREISDSKSFLENTTQKPVYSIAFPDGAYNDEVKSLCRKSGYKLMFSVNPRCQSDSIENDIYRRFSVPNTTTTDSVIFNSSLAFKNQGVL